MTTPATRRASACRDCRVPLVPAPGGGRPYTPAPPGHRHHAGRGYCRTCYFRHRRAEQRLPDWAAIDRAVGQPGVRLNKAERIAVVGILTARGWQKPAIAARLGICTRTVLRYRSLARANTPKAA